MTRGSVLAVLIAACGWPDETRPDERRALEIAWVQVLGMQIAPPPLYWDHTPCPYGDHQPALVWGSAEGGTAFCVLGVYEPYYEIHLGWRDKISESGLAHELTHAWLHKNGRGVDPGHAEPEWGWMPAKITAAWKAEGL